jgi:hypothetical protein
MEKGCRDLFAARFTRAVSVDDPALCQVVRRDFKIHSIAGQQFDVMPAQATGNMTEDRAAIFQFDRKGRAWENLLDRAEELERLFLDRNGGRDSARFLRGGALGAPGRTIAGSYSRPALLVSMRLQYSP